MRSNWVKFLLRFYGRRGPLTTSQDLILKSVLYVFICAKVHVLRGGLESMYCMFTWIIPVQSEYINHSQSLGAKGLEVHETKCRRNTF